MQLNSLCENPVHCDVNNDPYSSGLGLSGNFSVPLSDHEGGSLTRPSTRVEILCMTLALFGHYLNYLNKVKGKVPVCSYSYECLYSHRRKHCALCTKEARSWCSRVATKANLPCAPPTSLSTALLWQTASPAPSYSAQLRHCPPAHDCL